MGWHNPFSKNTWKAIAGIANPAMALAGSQLSGLLPSRGSSYNPNNDLNKAADVERNIYNPYIQNGQNAYGDLSNQFGAMNKDPAAYLENLMKSYQPTEAFNYNKQMQLGAAENSAAAGGTAGTISDIQNQGALANSLMSADMQKWLANTLGAQNIGLKGQQSIYDKGFNASLGLGGDLSNIAGIQAYNAAQAQAARNADRNNMFKNILSLGGTVAGAAYGGPAGAAAGGAAGRFAGDAFVT